jgi:NAD(P)-dependent dehydrogenase (short-subunit alcohol dehydrogenase family)
MRAVASATTGLNFELKTQIWPVLRGPVADPCGMALELASHGIRVNAIAPGRPLKVQCWVALDRAIRLATKRSLPLDHARLLAERDCIYEAVMTQGWDAERRTFVQYFGTDALDAADLIMPLVFFISPTDPRMIGTINRSWFPTAWCIDMRWVRARATG